MVHLAEVVLQQALTQQKELLDPNHERTAITRMALAELHMRLEQFPDALAEAKAAETALTITMGESHWYTSLSTNIRGAILGRMGHESEAETVLLESYRRLSVDDSCPAKYVASSLKRLIDFYWASGNRETPVRFEALQRQDVDKG